MGFRGNEVPDGASLVIRIQSEDDLCVCVDHSACR